MYANSLQSSNWIIFYHVYVPLQEGQIEKKHTDLGLKVNKTLQAQETTENKSKHLK